ncbi:hypothetical protein Bbelb_338680 [Branchiostoma belcheri]|nr:hypothetical protein Bbelb_338680 [Branchiostoma belcheri]
MEDSTDPTDTSVTDTAEDNYTHVRGLAKEWRKRYLRAQHQREELETLLRRLEEERQMEKVQQEELEQRSRLDLEEERRQLDRQAWYWTVEPIRLLRKGRVTVSSQERQGSNP